MSNEGNAHRCDGNPTPRHGTCNKCTVCGEYRNGWFDPASGLEMLVPPTGKVGEGDEARAGSIVREWTEHDVNESYNSDYMRDGLGSEALEERIAEALAAVRKEEREAAFNEAIGVAQAVLLPPSMRDARTQIVAALEAAATTGEKNDV